MTIIVFNFLPPSTNRCYRTANNRIYKTKIYTDFETQIKTFLNERNDIVKILGHVKLDITFYKKDNRQYDIDNRLKSFIDCIQNILIENDNNIIELNVKKYNNCLADSTTLQIESIIE